MDYPNEELRAREQVERRDIWVGRLFLLFTSALALAAVLTSGLESYVARLDRQRARRTMTAMRAIGQVVEAYAIAHGSYPSPPGSRVRSWAPVQKSGNHRPPLAWPVRKTQQAAGLRQLLSPRYVKKLRTRDGWGYPFLYATTSDGKAYTIVSTGRDGTLDAVGSSFSRGQIWDPDRDLVYADGGFLVWSW
jgi:type II secretory pathway pseudopilin PulG